MRVCVLRLRPQGLGLTDLGNVKGPYGYLGCRVQDRGGHSIGTVEN